MKSRTRTKAVTRRQLLATARQHFGIEEFRPGQFALIDAVLHGHNALGILPTGAGKSLAFQLPALYLSQTVVVVSPLISLMQDQLAHLEKTSLEAIRLDSTISPAQQRQYEEEIKRGIQNIVLVTPERLQSPERVEPLIGKVGLFVIDEAHCISQWGHDFRPAYLHLREVIQRLGNPPVLALTATAPPHLQDDIKTSLGLAQLEVVHTGIERPNLYFEVLRTVNRDEKEKALVGVIEAKSGSVIVYMATVKEVEGLHDWLIGRSLSVEKYHGRMSKKDRTEAQRRFMEGATPLIVATNAFGLGIDKPDVRAVVHWHFPSSVESYYQEAGRAGRDGELSKCVLLYQLEDKRIQSFFLGKNHPHEHQVLAILRSFDSENQAKGLTLKEVATICALPERRVSVLLAALLDLEVLTRRGRRLYLDKPIATDDLEGFVRGLNKQFDERRERLGTMMRYAETASCRAQFLRDYFGEKKGLPCGHCDNCSDPPAMQSDNSDCLAP